MATFARNTQESAQSQKISIGDTEGRDYIKKLQKGLNTESLQESNSSIISSTLVQRIKENNMKLSIRNERAEEEIERCHDQIARQASQNH